MDKIMHTMINLKVLELELVMKDDEMVCNRV